MVEELGLPYVVLAFRQILPPQGTQALPPQKGNQTMGEPFVFKKDDQQIQIFCSTSSSS